jgi:hypothetical protein
MGSSTVHNVFVASHALHFCVNTLSIFAIIHSPDGVRFATDAGHFYFAFFAVMATQASGIVKNGFCLHSSGFGSRRCSSRYKGDGTNQAYNESQEPKSESIGTHLFY